MISTSIPRGTRASVSPVWRFTENKDNCMMSEPSHQHLVLDGSPERKTAAPICGHGRADGALALLDHVGARQSYLLGASFGSTIALAALHRQPTRFPRAILQGGFACRPLAPAEVLLASLARYWPGPMRALPFYIPTMSRPHYEPFRMRSPEIWEFFLTRWGSPPMAAVARRALLLHRTDLRPLLPAIRQPILLACGDQDPL